MESAKQAWQAAEEAFRIEAGALAAMPEQLKEEPFLKAVEMLAGAERIASSGCGHSGIACQHFAHLMCCIERPARFISPAEAVHGGLVENGWPPREATMIGAAGKYLVFGAAMGSFALGFAADPQVYADRYPHLESAHKLADRAAQIDHESFEFALDNLIVGLRERFEHVAVS